MKWLVRWYSSGQMIVEADTEEEAKNEILYMSPEEIDSHEDEFEIEAIPRREEK